MRRHSISIIFMILLLCAGSCATASGNAKFVLIGVTPGDPTMRPMLSIAADNRVDFIRWNLIVEPKNRGGGKFSLKAVFGEAEQNTSDHKRGGETLSFAGDYTIAVIRGSNVFRFAGKDPRVRFSLVRLNDDIFHLLSSDGQLMVGDGGWSYSLFKMGSVADMSSELPRWTADLPKNEPLEVRFDGRTPCQEFIAEYKRSAAHGCYKLKWTLYLYRDPITSQPTTYRLLGTLYRDKSVEGNWMIDRGPNGTVIYRLDPGKPDRSMSFLAGDANVLFFLTRNDGMLRGNERFGFALNRRREL